MMLISRIAGVEAGALVEGRRFASGRCRPARRTSSTSDMRHLHLEEAGVDFQDVSGKQAADAGGLADAFQAHSGAGFDFQARRRGGGRGREGFDGFLDIRVWLWRLCTCAFWLSSPMVCSARCSNCAVSVRGALLQLANFCGVLFLPGLFERFFAGFDGCGAVSLARCARAPARRCDREVRLRNGTTSRSTLVMRDRATAIRCGSRPRRLAISRPADLPGAPRRSS